MKFQSLKKIDFFERIYRQLFWKRVFDSGFLLQKHSHSESKILVTVFQKNIFGVKTIFASNTYITKSFVVPLAFSYASVQSYSHVVTEPLLRVVALLVTFSKRIEFSAAGTLFSFYFYFYFQMDPQLIRDITSKSNHLLFKVDLNNCRSAFDSNEYLRVVMHERDSSFFLILG